MAVSGIRDVLGETNLHQLVVVLVATPVDCININPIVSAGRDATPCIRDFLQPHLFAFLYFNFSSSFFASNRSYSAYPPEATPQASRENNRKRNARVLCLGQIAIRNLSA